MPGRTLIVGYFLRFLVLFLLQGLRLLRLYKSGDTHIIKLNYNSLKTKNVYHLPVAPKDLGRVVSDNQLHSGFLQYALDFLIPENTPVVAALEGKIIEVKVDSKQGGFHKKYYGNQYLNWVTLAHQNGEYSQYAHLCHQGATVKTGDFVSAGECIGYSGNTGFSTCPHLHFHVYVPVATPPGWYTREVQFFQSLKIVRNKFRIFYEVLKFKISNTTFNPSKP